VYNDWLMSSFNIFFTNFPVLALGVLDQDVRPQSCLECPELYKETQMNSQFTSRRRLFWFVNGIYVAVVCFFAVFYGVHGGESDTASGRPFGLWEVGTTLYILLWFLLNVALSETEVYYSTYSYQTFVPIVSKQIKFWMSFWPIALLGLLPYIIVMTLYRHFRPTLADEVQNRDAANKETLGGQSEKEGPEPDTKIAVEMRSPRRCGTLKGVVIESLGIEKIEAETIKAPKHRRKLSFADVWGSEKNFPDVPGTASLKISEDGHGRHSRQHSVDLRTLQTLKEGEILESRTQSSPVPEVNE
jgi:hypothetical protein